MIHKIGLVDSVKSCIVSPPTYKTCKDSKYLGLYRID
jgi:hypothetical protein